MSNITDMVGPEQCSDCGTYGLCECKPLIPRVASKGKWDYECPGDYRCVCNDSDDN